MGEVIKAGVTEFNWRLVKLSKCTRKIGSGITPKGGDSVYVAAGVPLIRSQNILNGVFSAEGLRYITSEQHDRMSGSKVYPNDILFNITGASIGRCCLFPLEMEEANVNQHVCIVRLKEGFHAPFFAYVLSSKVAKRALHESQAGGGREGLNFKNLGDFKIYVPPLPEQKAIASVLQCWDWGIEQLEAKLAAKDRIKKGLMQQLLSGQIRLPGFGRGGRIAKDEWRMPEGWENIPLGEIFSFVKAYAFSREQLTDESSEAPFVYNIHYGDLHARYPGPLLDFERERRVPVLKAEVARAEVLDYLRPGDLVMADVSEDFKGVGACVELVNLKRRKVTAGLHTFVLRDIDGKTAEGFRGYLFKEYGLAKELRRIATGVSVYGLSKTNLSKVLLALPPLDEQKAIVEVLSAADREIDALRRKLAVWKAQKKYLLNNLVDGSIRLPEFASAAKEVAG